MFAGNRLAVCGSLNSFKYVALSAVLFGAASPFPYTMGWTALCYLALIFYAAQINKLTFWHGFFWGCIVYAIHWYAILILFFERLIMPEYVILLLYVVLILYAAFYAGCWFLCAAYLCRVMPPFWAWLVATLGYWCFTLTSMFFITGQWIGYPFTNPLLFLATDIRYLYALPIIGNVCLYLILIIASWMLARAVRGKIKWYYCVVCYLPFFIGFSMPCDNEPLPAYVKNLAALQPMVHITHPLDCAQYINEAIEVKSRKNKNATLFLLPESSFPFSLNSCEHAVQMWQHNALCDEKKTLIIGAYKAVDQERTMNAFFCIDQARITNFYVKTKLMPFTEYLPYFWAFFIKNARFSFIPSDERKTQMSLTRDLCVAPYLCFEFFFYLEGGVNRNINSLLVLINDSWFSIGYARELMKLYAIYAALCGKQSIIYIGHSAGYYIHKNGKHYII